MNHSQAQMGHMISNRSTGTGLFYFYCCKDMAGMRDVLIHDYINVEIDIVWKTVVAYLPPLLEKINEIIEEINL